MTPTELATTLDTLDLLLSLLGVCAVVNFGLLLLIYERLKLKK